MGRPQIIAKCRYENNRRMLPFAYGRESERQSRARSTSRHVYVKQYDSEFGTKHVFQRFFARFRGDDVLSEIRQYRLIDQQLRRAGHPRPEC